MKLAVYRIKTGKDPRPERVLLGHLEVRLTGRKPYELLAGDIELASGGRAFLEAECTTNRPWVLAIDDRDVEAARGTYFVEAFVAESETAGVVTFAWSGSWIQRPGE